MPRDVDLVPGLEDTHAQRARAGGEQHLVRVRVGVRVRVRVGVRVGVRVRVASSTWSACRMLGLAWLGLSTAIEQRAVQSSAGTTRVPRPA